MHWPPMRGLGPLVLGLGCGEATFSPLAVPLPKPQVRRPKTHHRLTEFDHCPQLNMDQPTSIWNKCLDYATLSDLGLRRANNQDACAVVLAGNQDDFEQCGHLFMVADGMGAHAAGEMASKMATDVVPLVYRKRIGSVAARGHRLGRSRRQPANPPSRSGQPWISAAWARPPPRS